MQPSYKLLPSYNHLFEKNKGNRWVNGKGSVERITVPAMLENISKYSYQAHKLANHLYDSDVKQAAYNVWHFCFHNFKYKIERGEKLRLPSRSWADRYTGIDCDCFTILACSCLKEMGYNNPEMVIIQQHGEPNWNHVYARVSGYVIDPCPPLTNFNQEATNIYKKMVVETLNGQRHYEAMNGLGRAYNNEITKALIAEQNEMLNSGDYDPADLRKLRWLISLDKTEAQEMALKIAPMVRDVSKEGFLIFEEGLDYQTAGEYIALQEMKAEDDLQGLGSMQSEVDLDLFNIEEELDEIDDLQGLGLNRTVMRKSPFFRNKRKNRRSRFFNNSAKKRRKNKAHCVNGLGEMNTSVIDLDLDDIGKFYDDELADLGRFRIGRRRKKKGRKKKRGIFRNVRSKIKKAYNKTKAAVKKGTKAVSRGVKKFAKNPLHYVNKLNPATVVVRNAFLLGMRINVFGLSKKLKWGYLTEAQAMQKGKN
jgi:hypothetical protein